MFREKFRYYKRKVPPPDLSNVLDFSGNFKFFTKVKGYNVDNIDCEELGIIDPVQWKIYESDLYKGLYVVRNPFTGKGQRYWISKCLSSFTRRPNIINLHIQGNPDDNEDWWNNCKGNDTDSCSLKKSLRWATLGYHHNWDTKVYSETAKTEFPPDLGKLCSIVALVVLNANDYSAEAAIVNFYHMDSTLSGHTDYSEPNREAPLISFSFGQSAIFLIGGLTLEENPMAMFLHSGDVVIMAGGSRLRYHGVPRIVKVPAEPWRNDDYFGDHEGYYFDDDDGGTTSRRTRDDEGLLLRAIDTNSNSSDDKNNLHHRDNDCNERNFVSRSVSLRTTDEALMKQTKQTIHHRHDDDDLADNVIKRRTTGYPKVGGGGGSSSPPTAEDYGGEQLNYLRWKPFDEYVKWSRINVNVRQVLSAGQKSLPLP